MLGTLEKAQRVLDLYSPARPEWGVGEVARECGWPPSSTHLLLSSLAHTGLLHRTVAGRYRLGFKLHRLSQILLHNTPWREVVAGELRALCAQTGETTYAAALDGAHLVTVAAFQGAHRHALAPAQLSEEPPLHASATGKVLLAFRTAWGHPLPRRLPRLTPHTITTRAALSAELDEVRARGVAFSLEEAALEVCSVAAPVHNHNGEVIAAVCLISPAEHFGAARVGFGAAVRLSAARTDEQLGYQPGLQRGSGLISISSGGVDALRARPRRGGGGRRRSPEE